MPSTRLDVQRLARPALLLASLMLVLVAAPALAVPPVVPGNPAPPEPEASPLAGATPEGAARQTALTAGLVLKVVHPAQVRATLIQEARRRGGFATLITEHELQLKVPPAELLGLMEQVAAAGLVLDKSMERKDLTEQIAQLAGKLRSKQDIFLRLRSFLDSSGVEATLQIEQTMSELVSEMEQIKGQLQQEEERAQWAQVEISFRFTERERIVYVHSPFGWLNTVDLDRFLQEFGQ